MGQARRKSNKRISAKGGNLPVHQKRGGYKAMIKSCLRLEENNLEFYRSIKPRESSHPIVENILSNAVPAAIMVSSLLIDNADFFCGKRSDDAAILRVLESRVGTLRLIAHVGDTMGLVSEDCPAHDRIIMKKLADALRSTVGLVNGIVMDAAIRMISRKEGV